MSGEILRVVRGILLFPRERVLVVKRPMDKKNSPGQWSLPGGKAESGDLESELERELLEELGIVIRGFNFLSSKRKLYQGWEWEQTYLWSPASEVDDTQIAYNQEEIDAVAKVDLQQVRNMDFAFGDDVILEWFLANWRR